METNNITPFMAVRPTEIIKDEIKARGMSKKEFAERMGMRPSNISRLLKGEDISVSMASKLENALGIDASFWLDMQTNYEKDIKAIEKRNTQEKSANNTERVLSTFLNLPQLYKHFGIKKEMFIDEKLKRLKDLLGFDPIDLGRTKLVYQFKFKKSDKLDVDDINQNTWLTMAYVKAKNSQLAVPFEKGNAHKAAEEISNLSKNENIKEKEIKSCLNKYGIIYEVEPKLPKVPIDAVTVNLGERPAIIVTHRYNDMAMLIFNTIHELGHIDMHMYKYNKEMFVSSDKEYSSKDPMEEEANTFAENILIDPNTWNQIMSTTSRLWNNDIVKELKKSAKKFNFNEHIVIWRYKHDCNKYNLNGVTPYHIV